jgi:hypothetical protein
MLEVVETLRARGHPNVRARHRTTLEITREGWLSKRADCIIGVLADKGAKDLGPEFKRAARMEGSRVVIELFVGGLREVIMAEGSPLLSFEHPNDLVIRRSEFVCPRTIAIRADKAAADISREMVKLLRRPDSELIVKLKVKAT